MEFDFDSYLGALFPGHTYQSERLAGGLVNVTARSRRTSSLSSGGDISPTDVPPQSLVLKHAPPYIAALGEEAPFSQDRQTIEATVLKLFGDDGPLSHLNTFKRIHVPRVIKHDSLAFVLSMEDLGPLIPLWGLFSPPFIDASPLEPSTLIHRCIDLGQRVGSFFADVHSPATYEAILSEANRDPDIRVLRHSLTANVVFDAAVSPILSRLKEQGGLDPTQAENLYQRVRSDYERKPYPAESCLSMGDCHPGSVLVAPEALLGSEATMQVGAIDWEFATIDGGRGINGDMAQFFASFHVLLLSLPKESLTYKAVEAFVGEVAAAYAAGSGLSGRVAAARERGDWTDDSALLGLLRSALILHGRETINQAVEREWNNSSGVSVGEMVQAGIWYLERASGSVAELMKDKNWDALLGEKSGIMLRLFGIEK